MDNEAQNNLRGRCWICRRTVEEAERDLRKLVTDNPEIEKFKDGDVISINHEEGFPEIELYKKADKEGGFDYVSTREDITVPLCVVCLGLFESRLKEAEYVIKEILDEGGYVNKDSVVKIVTSEQK